MLKIAIIGCGKIADEHASQIQRIKGCEIVAVCDKEPLMARQFCERFPVKRYFGDLKELVSETRPDVVHITTPPQSHFDIARFCLERGCHVYVEKPFTLNTEEAQTLVTLADEKGFKLTVGHDEQFSHVARRMRTLVQGGYLGGAPVHMESYYCYNLGDSDYAQALLSDSQHWIRKLPGRLLHNVISHGIAKIAEFLTSDAPRVIAHGFVSPVLRGKGEGEIVDELRVILLDDKNTTAYFTFSSQMRPALRQFRLYGLKNGLVVDQDQQSLIRLRGGRFKSYAEKFFPHALFAAQHFGNVGRNAKYFLASDFHMKSGMKFLIESFYRSIIEEMPVPIPYPEIVRTTMIMDSIFEQLGVTQSKSAPSRVYPSNLGALDDVSKTGDQKPLQLVDIRKGAAG